MRTELAHCHWMRGYVHAQDGDGDGDPERAEDELRTAHDMLTAKWAALYADQVEVELADVPRGRGKTQEAEALLRPLLAAGPRTTEIPALRAGRGAVHRGAAHRLLGLIAEECGDAEAAEEHYRAALPLLERAGAAGDMAACAVSSVTCSGARDAPKPPWTPTAPASPTGPPRARRPWDPRPRHR